MGSIASKNFGLDQLNNWSTYGEDPDGTGMSNLSQTRDHNAANEIEEIDSANTFVAHDAAGNMTTVPKPGVWNAGLILIWDAWNRLVKVEDGVNTVAQYQYDGKNRRIVKKLFVSGSFDHDEHFYLSEANQVLEVRKDASTTPHKQFTWGGRYIDDLVLRTRDTDNNGTVDETLYAVQDANWDITALADTSGTVVERFRYDPYGRNLVLEEDFAVDPDGKSDYDWEYRFTSREYDAETSLHYFRARYWHPNLGRFVGRDPLEYVDGGSLYAGYFVPQVMDPWGLEIPRSEPSWVWPWDPRATWTPAWEPVLDTAQGGLELGGFVPGCGAIPDLTNAIISTCRGNYDDALFSAGAAIPGFGDAAAAAKLGKRVSKAADARKIGKTGGKAADACPTTIIIDGSRYPESAKHAQDAINAGVTPGGVVDRSGATPRRSDRMRNEPRVPGMDRDEFPPAVLDNGGGGHSVRPVTPGDNRGAGSSIGHQLDGVPDGTPVIITPINVPTKSP